MCALGNGLFRSGGREDGRYFRYPSKLTGKNPSAKPGMVKGGGKAECASPFGAHALITHSPGYLAVTLVTVGIHLILGLSHADTRHQALRVIAQKDRKRHVFFYKLPCATFDASSTMA